jgi:hypothetical protein
MSDVFVSYATGDRDLAAAIVGVLEKQRLRVFWDRNIPAGERWQDVLRRHLNNSKCVVAVFTRASLGSSWVALETSVARHRDVLVPLLFDRDIDPQKDLPEIYRDLQIVALPKDCALVSQCGRKDIWVSTVKTMIRRSLIRRVLRTSVLVAGLLWFAISILYVGRTAHDSLVGWQAGIAQMESGKYSKEENERLARAIREAHTIELLVPNAVSFTATFRDDLPVFFKNSGALMRVNFANPESEFYDAMMTMTNPGFAAGPARASDKGLPDRSRQILLDFAAGDRSKVAFRQFNTEFRVPLILIDRKYCLMTVRLTPAQGTQSLRLELVTTSTDSGRRKILAGLSETISSLFGPSNHYDDAVAACTRHFDAVWARSQPI